MPYGSSCGVPPNSRERDWETEHLRPHWSFDGLPLDELQSPLHFKVSGWRAVPTEANQKRLFSGKLPRPVSSHGM